MGMAKCRHCGEEGTPLESFHFGHSVYCRVCGSRGPTRPTQEAAEDSWNGQNAMGEGCLARLRDEFAMAALTGLMMAEVYPVENAARLAFVDADAMLAARGKNDGGE